MGENEEGREAGGGGSIEDRGSMGIEDRGSKIEVGGSIEDRGHSRIKDWSSIELRGSTEDRGSRLGRGWRIEERSTPSPRTLGAIYDRLRAFMVGILGCLPAILEASWLC